MTPQEKAFHLYFKYIREVIADKDKAKRCALIAVEEIMKLLPLSNRDFWLQVKHEVNNI